MICPKCQNVMHTVERQHVHIEQCAGCKGIFLDHGELEQMAVAEQRHYAAPPAAYQSAPPPPGAYPPAGGHYPPPHQQQRYRDSPPGYRDSPPGHSGHRDSPPAYGYGGHGGQYGHQKRRKSFLEDLFD